jgi:transcriptional regulator GlxA family with amidase domain
MTNSSVSTTAIRPRELLFVAYPHMGLLDMSGAQTVFWAADSVMRNRGLPGYSRTTAIISGQMTATVEGVPVATVPHVPEARSLRHDYCPRRPGDTKCTERARPFN